MPDSTEHIAIYLRVSTGEQDVDHQRLDCYKTAEREFPGVLTVEYPDEGISASKHDMTEREYAARMIAAIAEGEVIAVIAWAQDRLSRRGTAEMGGFLDHCRTNGVRIISATEGEIHADDMSGEIVSSVRAVMAKYEGISKGKRARSGQMALAREGKWPKGKPPRGYDRDPETKALVPNETAFLIREAFERFADGESRNSLAVWLTDTTDMTWKRWNVVSMLKNRAYIGWLEHGGEKHKGEHDPLVNEELFERVQDRLIEAKGFDMRYGRRSPFGAKLRCECGQQLHYHDEPRLGHANYECRTCRLRYHAENIEFAFMLVMEGAGKYLTEQLADTDWRVANDTTEEQSLRAELQELTQERTNLLGLVAKGDRIAEEMADDLRKRADAIERALRQLTASWETKRQLLAATAEAWDGFDWPAATVAERHQRVTGTIESLRVATTGDPAFLLGADTTTPVLVVRPRGWLEELAAPIFHGRRGVGEQQMRNQGIGVSVFSPWRNRPNAYSQKYVRRLAMESGIAEAAYAQAAAAFHERDLSSPALSDAITEGMEQINAALLKRAGAPR